MTFQVVIERGSDGYFAVDSPSLKSCCTQGKTREEALENIKEAILLFLEPEPLNESEAMGQEIVELTL